MSSFHKLAIVSAVSMISAGAFAMEALDDAGMAATTGQDGVTISILLPNYTVVNANTSYTSSGVLKSVQEALTGSGTGFAGINIHEVRIHDRDGVAATETQNATAIGLSGVGTTQGGAIVIGGGGTLPDGTVLTAANDVTEVYTHDVAPITINVDSADNNGSPLLNVHITTPTLAIHTAAVYVASSSDYTGAANVSARGATIANKTAIMSGMDVTVGNADTYVQLGHESQGHMVVLNTTLNGGLTISNLKLFDSDGTNVSGMGQNASGGYIGLGSLAINNAGQTSGYTLGVKAYVDVGSRLTAAQQGAIVTQLTANGITAASVGATNYGNIIAGLTAKQDLLNGLVLNLATLGDATNGVDIAMDRVHLGDVNATGSLGDVQVLGLNLNGLITVVTGH